MRSTTEEETIYQDEAEIEIESLVRLRLITHNARLVDARKERGINQQDMALAINTNQLRISNIETLKVIPTDEEMARIASILEKPIDYLFPEELLFAVEAGVFSRRKVELAAPEVISLTEAERLHLLPDTSLHAVEEEVERKLLAERINEALNTLEPREQRVIRLRFGFDGRPRLLEEVGREFNLTRERIRQIESKALRKLRHPSRSRVLKDYLGEE